MAVQVEVQGKRIRVDWSAPTSAQWKTILTVMKTVPARRFHQDEKYWTVPLDMQSCRDLRTAFDAFDLQIGPALRSWATEAKRAEQRLGSLSANTAGRLANLPTELPFLYRALYLGPLYKNATKELGYSDGQLNYAASLFSAVTGVDFWDGDHGSYQTADVRFMSDSPAPGNFNHQGLGKTPETIGAVWEAGLQVGSHLVLTPSAAVESVWGEELRYWQLDSFKYNVDVFTCTGNRAKREETLRLFAASKADVKWLVVNPAMVMWRKDPTHKAKHIVQATPKNKPPKSACRCGKSKSAHWHYETSYPIIDKTPWTTITNDEAHKGGNVRNHRSISGRAINDLVGGKKQVLTGTPMKTFGADIWGILHFLRPDVFTSFWKFAESYFTVDKEEFGWTVGGLRKGREGDFFKLLTQYALRRTKKDVLKWLPDKQHVDVWVELEGKQAKQYRDMEANGFVSIDGANVSSTSILAEFTRLTQFARTLCSVKDGQVMPLVEGAKVDALMQKLDEAGILSGTSSDQTVIFSESRKVIDGLADHLESLGVSVGRVTGAAGNVKDRPQMVRDFQEGKVQVMCIVTTAGGVALTLDAADTAHFLEDPWAPDEAEQAEDRIHRGSRMHQVTIYHYRAKDTIDEYRQEVSIGKDNQQKYILDVRRVMLDRIKDSK